MTHKGAFLRPDMILNQSSAPEPPLGKVNSFRVEKAGGDDLRRSAGRQSCCGRTVQQHRRSKRGRLAQVKLSRIQPDVTTLVRTRFETGFPFQAKITGQAYNPRIRLKRLIIFHPKWLFFFLFTSVQVAAVDDRPRGGVSAFLPVRPLNHTFNMTGCHKRKSSLYFTHTRARSRTDRRMCTRCSEDKDYFEKLISHQMFKPDPRLQH